MASTVVSVPKYRHHKGSGQAFVQLQGRRYYLGKWNSPQSKDRYARFVAELAVRPATIPAANPATPEPQLTVMELCAAYLDFAQGYYIKDGRLTHQMGTVRRAIRLVKELYGHAPATEFGPLALRAVQEHMVKNPGIRPDTGKPRCYSRSTINSTCGAIKRMFRWAASHELIPVAVHQALATVPGLKKGCTAAREGKAIRPVADEVVDATLPHLPVVVADMVRFQRLTGSRPGEVCQLRPMDVDRSGEVWQYRPESHKTQHHDRSDFQGLVDLTSGSGGHRKRKSSLKPYSQGICGAMCSADNRSGRPS